MAQMKEQIKTPEKELSTEEIDVLSDAQFKTLVIKMLTELVEFGHKLNEKMKAVLRETKENVPFSFVKCGMCEGGGVQDGVE